MKLFTSTPLIVVMLLVVATPKAAALFGHAAVERERRQDAEQQAARERQTNDHLYVVVSVLSVGVVVALVIGAAVGSKAKKDHEA